MAWSPACDPDRAGRLVPGARPAFVGRQHQEGLGRPVARQRVVELDFGHGRARAAQIARGRVDEEVLARSIETIIPGDLRRVHARPPPGMADEPIDEQALTNGLRHLGPDALQHPPGRFGVTANRSDVGFDDRDGDPHG